jgi:hypothetical protein
MILKDAPDPPLWKERHKVHDWRNYIPYDVRVNWGNLSQDSKNAFYYMAELQADNEEWD